MITYGFSIQGKSHAKRGTVCQDSHKTAELKYGWRIAVIADGVGSASRSDQGSKIAVEETIAYCMNAMDVKRNENQLMKILQNAYSYALNQIETNCDEQGGKMEDYDATLSTALYNGETLIYGHAGDGGVIARGMTGEIEAVTKPQKGVDGISVRPLRAGKDSWEFGVYDKKVAAVLLVTDGMLDALTPFLLNLPKDVDKIKAPSAQKKNVYITLAEFFMNPYCVYKNKKVKNPNQLMENFLQGKLDNDAFHRCIRAGYGTIMGKKEAEVVCKTIERYHYSTWTVSKVTDDITVVCMMNDGCKIRMKDYHAYKEADWKSLQKQYERLAYPKLFDKGGEKDQVNNDVQKKEVPIVYQKQRIKASEKMARGAILILVSLYVVVSMMGLINLSIRNRKLNQDNRELKMSNQSLKTKMEHQKEETDGQKNKTKTQEDVINKHTKKPSEYKNEAEEESEIKKEDDEDRNKDSNSNSKEYPTNREETN